MIIFVYSKYLFIFVRNKNKRFQYMIFILLGIIYTGSAFINGLILSSKIVDEKIRHSYELTNDTDVPYGKIKEVIIGFPIINTYYTLYLIVFLPILFK